MKAGDEVKGSSHTAEGGYEEVGSDGKWRYTEKGAARNNAQQWYANGTQTKAWRKALEESKARSGRLESQIDGSATTVAPPKTTTKTSPTSTAKTTPKVEAAPSPIDKSKFKFTPDADGIGEQPDTKQTEEDLKNVISYYEKQRSTVATTAEEYAQWTEKIDVVKGKLDALQGVKPDTDGIEKTTDALEDLKEESMSAFDAISGGWGDIKGIGSGISSISDALSGNADAWTTITGVVDGALQMYQSISGIVGIIDALTGASELGTVAETGKAAATVASTAAQTAEAGVAEGAAAAQIPVIAANKLAATSYMELAAAEYMAAHAAIPFAGFGIGAGFVASANALVLAQQAIPFADGGIVSGPTYALVGEYAGASHNPEVIAPLDKLKDMVGSSGGGGRVEFRIRGKNLVGAMANQTRIQSASGRRTNIKI